MTVNDGLDHDDEPDPHVQHGARRRSGARRARATSPTARAAATRPPARSSRASPAASTRSATTSTTNGTAAEFANCYDPSWGGRSSRARARSPATTTGTPATSTATSATSAPGRRHRDGAVLQLRRRLVLARRRARQRLHAGRGRLRRGLAAGAVADQRPGRQLLAQRDRDVAPPALQLRRLELHRVPAVRRRAVRSACRPRARRSRPHLRAVHPARSDAQCRSDQRHPLTSRWARAAPAITPSARSSRRVRPTTSRPGASCASRCTPPVTTSSSSRSPASASRIPPARRSPATTRRRARPASQVTPGSAVTGDRPHGDRDQDRP